MNHSKSFNCQNESGKCWFDLQFHDNDQQRIMKPDEVLIDVNKDYPPSQIKQDILNRIQGSMFGMTIGDALGAHVEFRPHDYLVAKPVQDFEGGGTWGLEKGQFTDDTSMALCLANSLVACHGFVPYDQLVRYKWWYRYGYMSSTGQCFDIGAATRQSIQQFEARQREFAQEFDIPLDQMDSLSDSDLCQRFNVYCSSDGVAGNGALMRLAPVPLFYYQDPEIAVEYSGVSGQITHGDTKAYDACRYYGALIVAALQGVNKNVLLSNTFYEEHKQWFGDKTLHQDIMNIAHGSYKKQGGYDEGIRGKGYVVSALEAALWAFWSDENSFEKGALNAVNLGDDTDTTAAIYGQLAGAYYGYNNLPEKWREQIYAKKFVLCVSNGIAYEGEKWFMKQKPLDTAEVLINSNDTTPNKPLNPSINFNREHHSIKTNRSISFASVTNKMMVAIDRKAIDPSGRIGCLYDACQDRILKSQSTNFKIHKTNPVIKCIYERGSNPECQNLLRFIGCDEEFRLSVSSDIVSPKGIASVVKYPYLIDECTRILYYSYETRQDFLPDTINDIEEKVRRLTSTTEATHVITKVFWGIEVIALLRLTSDDTKTVDATLNEIYQCLINETTPSTKISFEKILSTHIYSNIPNLANQKTIMDLFHVINKTKNDTTIHIPYNYTLHPVEAFHPDGQINALKFISFKPKLALDVEQYLLRLSSVTKMWETFFDKKLLEVLTTKLKGQVSEADHRLSKLIIDYNDEKKRLQNLIIVIRQGKHSKETIERQLLTEEMQTKMVHSIEDFIFSLTSLKEKGYFISDLKTRGFDYQNASNHDIKQGDEENNIESKLIGDKCHRRILCSNDALNISNWQKLEDLYSKMLHERKSNPHLDLIYVDFTYCSYSLDEIKVFPSSNYIKSSNEHKPLSLSKLQISSCPLLPPNDNQIINILLLGKSGAGKSTLINTFINYLKFDNYEDTQQCSFSLPVLIPLVRFIMGTLQDGRLIRRGNWNPNENYDHADQSVTQQCKLYNFKINNKEKICIIDTPGFGKTHNQNDDDITMQHILSRVINITHLDAICVVLESDDVQLDAYQTCLTELVRCLGTNAGNNIVFCFTKSLSNNIDTTQRDTSIKLMIDSLNMKNIRYSEQTAFFFDSTYFTDSTVSRQFVPDYNTSKQNSEKSWNISKIGWNRLLNSIRQNRPPYITQQGIQNVERIRIKINQLVRPILETIRNNMRNIILLRRYTTTYSIKLHPKPILHPSAICYFCKRNPYRYGGFCIMTDSPHQYQNRCYDCLCTSNQHMHIDYLLEYEYCINRTTSDVSQVSNDTEKLLYIMAHLALFLMNSNSIANNEPFLTYLNHMIDEEKFIGTNIASGQLNMLLHNQLVYFKENYRQKINIIKQSSHHNDLNVDDLIEIAKQIPTVKIQVDMAQRMQETSIEIYNNTTILHH